MPRQHFCNNCGHSGHYFNQCNKPIISNGVIAFKKINNVLHLLMICRKDSLGFVDFMRGKYSLNDGDYLRNIISEMTISEKEKLLTKDFESLWKELWSSDENVIFKNEKIYSINKFNLLKNGIICNNEILTLKKLIDEDINRWVTPEWGFPKGRRESGENDKNCGMREFIEETGIPINENRIIENLFPYEEIFIGSNYKSYKHKYFLCYIPQEQPMDRYQRMEVSDMRWFSIEECIEKIRPYDLEKKEMVRKIDALFNNYLLIS